MGAQAQDPLLRVHFMDVGYGDAILVQSPHGHTTLIDAGDAAHAPELRDYLRKQGLGRLDRAVLTHPHKNHFEGFSGLLQEFPIGEFVINGDRKNAEDGYEGLLQDLKQNGIPVRVARSGQTLLKEEHGLMMQALNPTRLSRDIHDDVIVLLLRYRHNVVLLTSDLSVAQQKIILREHSEVRDADVVQVPHHGGKLDDIFTEALQNKIFVVSTGKNGQGKPFAVELQKLRGRVHRTDASGTIEIVGDGERIWVQQ